MTAPEQPAKIEITEHLIDVIGTPVIAFTSLALIAEQIEALGFLYDHFEGSRAWPEEARLNMLYDVRDRVLTIKQFAESALTVVDAEIKFTQNAEVPE